MNLLQIRYFVEVASKQSLASAAKELYVSPSTLSVSISNLEKSLQTKLFVRDNTGMYLTDAGKLIFEDAKTVISLIDSWPQRLHPETGDISGTVHIISRPMITDSLLVDVVHVAKQHHPQLELIIEDNLFSEQMLSSKTLNLAFAIFLENDSSYISLSQKALSLGYTSELLYQMSLRVFLHPDNPLASKENVTLSDLKEYSFVVLYNSKENPFFQSLLEAFQDSQIVALPNRNAIMRYIETNPNAFSFLTSSAEMNEKYNQTGTLCQVPLENDFYTQFVYLFYPDKQHITPAEKHTVDIIKKLI